MNTTYTMNKDVRNNFRRMLKNVSENSDLRWDETDDVISGTVTFDLSGNENALHLVEKFNNKMNTVQMTVKTKKKHFDKIKNIVEKHHGSIVPCTEKDYYIITVLRCYKNTLKSSLISQDFVSSVSSNGIAY